MPPARARADDDDSVDILARVDAWKEMLESHLEAGNDDAWKADLERARDLYQAAKDHAKGRKELIRRVGQLTKGRRDEVRAVAALQVLGALGDAGGARYIRAQLRQRDAREASSTLRAAIAAAGKVPEPSLVQPLLRLVTESKHMGVVRESVASLGAYGVCRRKRIKILQELIAAARRVKPGGRPRMRGAADPMNGGFTDGSTPIGQSGGPAARWTALSRSVPAALRRLTGIEELSIQGWLALVSDNKGSMARLFRKKA